MPRPMFMQLVSGVRRGVHKMVIAVDVDGTLFDGREVAEQAIRRAHQGTRRRSHAGHRHRQAMGGARARRARRSSPSTARVVCEEGGVLVNVATGRADRCWPSPSNRNSWPALRAAGVPALDIGHVVVGAPTSSLATVTEVRDRVGSSRIIVTNKGSIALTQAGCDKGTGLLAAIADLHAEDLPILAIGDAANDLPMFRDRHDRRRRC